MTEIKIKRVYDEPESSDGYRILVDRLWPRGETKEEVPYDIWAKEISPSESLREWFHKDTDGHWKEFKEKYMKELKEMPAMQELVKKIEGKDKVTLLYSSKNTEKNNAAIVGEYLQKELA